MKIYHKFRIFKNVEKLEHNESTSNNQLLKNDMKIKDNNVELMTLKDYVALVLALLSLFLPWALIFSGIYALVIFLLTKFWLK